MAVKYGRKIISTDEDPRDDMKDHIKKLMADDWCTPVEDLNVVEYNITERNEDWAVTIRYLIDDIPQKDTIYYVKS